MKVMQSFFNAIWYTLFGRPDDGRLRSRGEGYTLTRLGHVFLGEHMQVTLFVVESKDAMKKFKLAYKSSRQTVPLSTAQYSRLLDSKYTREQLIQIDGISDLMSQGRLVVSGHVEDL